MTSSPRYAAGYATGNYVGILVENKIAFGYQLFRVYTKKNGHELALMLNTKFRGVRVIRTVVYFPVTISVTTSPSDTSRASTKKFGMSFCVTGISTVNRIV